VGRLCSIALIGVLAGCLNLGSFGPIESADLSAPAFSNPPPYTPSGDMAVPIFDCCSLTALCPLGHGLLQPAPDFKCTTPGFTFDCSCDSYGFVHCGAGDHWCNPLGYDLAERHDLAAPPDGESGD